MRPLQRPIDERLSVSDDDPSQEHPELGISCPGLSLRTKASTVDRDLKGHGEKEGEREREKGGKEGGDILFKQLRECEIERYQKKMEHMYDFITE